MCNLKIELHELFPFTSASLGSIDQIISLWLDRLSTRLGCLGPALSRLSLTLKWSTCINHNIENGDCR